MANSLFYVAGAGANDGGIWSICTDEQTGKANIAASYSLPGAYWLCHNKRRNILYCAVNKQNGKDDGSIAAFSIGKGGALAPVAETSTGGRVPCYICTDPGGDFLYCANYMGGSVAVIRLQEGVFTSDKLILRYPSGSGVDTKRQEAAHPHFICFSGDGKTIYMADLGADILYTYQYNAETGISLDSETCFPMHPGSGPRHICFGQSGEMMYIANELQNSVSVLHNCGKHMELLQTVSACGAQFENYPSAIRRIEDKNLLIVANRGADTLRSFLVRKDGLLEAADEIPSGGRWPRDFHLTRNGRFLATANELSNEVCLIDTSCSEKGKASITACIHINRPFCILPGLADIIK